jgi:anti-sigma regulatory factor (Ser/Thr protein kinase)
VTCSCRSAIPRGSVPTRLRPHEAGHIHLNGLQAPRTGRSFVRARLAALPAELVETAELLTSELVTNGILHARTGLQLGVSCGSDEVLVTVKDHYGAPPRQPSAPDADALPQDGRGMTIIATLADDFGWRLLPDHTGKIVWFTLRIEGGQRHEERLSSDVEPRTML